MEPTPYIPSSIRNQTPSVPYSPYNYLNPTYRSTPEFVSPYNKPQIDPAVSSYFRQQEAERQLQTLNTSRPAVSAANARTTVPLYSRLPYSGTAYLTSIDQYSMGTYGAVASARVNALGSNLSDTTYMGIGGWFNSSFGVPSGADILGMTIYESTTPGGGPPDPYYYAPASGKRTLGHTGTLGVIPTTGELYTWTLLKPSQIKISVADVNAPTSGVGNISAVKFDWVGRQIANLGTGTVINSPLVETGQIRAYLNQQHPGGTFSHNAAGQWFMLNQTTNRWEEVYRPGQTMLQQFQYQGAIDQYNEDRLLRLTGEDLEERRLELDRLLYGYTRDKYELEQLRDRIKRNAPAPVFEEKYGLFGEELNRLLLNYSNVLSTPYIQDGKWIGNEEQYKWYISAVDSYNAQLGLIQGKYGVTVEGYNAYISDYNAAAIKYTDAIGIYSEKVSAFNTKWSGVNFAQQVEEYNTMAKEFSTIYEKEFTEFRDAYSSQTDTWKKEWADVGTLMWGRDWLTSSQIFEKDRAQWVAIGSTYEEWKNIFPSGYSLYDDPSYNATKSAIPWTGGLGTQEYLYNMFTGVTSHDVFGNLQIGSSVYDPTLKRMVEKPYTGEYLFIQGGSGTRLQVRQDYLGSDIERAISQGVISKSESYDIFTSTGRDIGDITPEKSPVWSTPISINASMRNILYGEGAGQVYTSTRSSDNYGSFSQVIQSDTGRAEFVQTGIRNGQMWGTVTVRDASGKIIDTYETSWLDHALASQASVSTAGKQYKQLISPGSDWGVTLVSESGQKYDIGTFGIDSATIAKFIDLPKPEAGKDYGDMIWYDKIEVLNGYYYGVTTEGKYQRLNKAEPGVLPDLGAYAERTVLSVKPPAGSPYKSYEVINGWFYAVDERGYKTRLNPAVPGSSPDIKYTGYDIPDWTKLDIPKEWQTNIGGFVGYQESQRTVDKLRQDYINSYWESIKYYNPNEPVKIYDPITQEFAGTVYKGEVWKPGTFGWQSRLDLKTGDYTQFAAGIKTLDSMGVALKDAPAGLQYYDPLDTKHPYKTVGAPGIAIEPTGVDMFVAQRTFDTRWATNPKGYELWQSDMAEQVQIHKRERALEEYLYNQVGVTGEKTTYSENLKKTNLFADLPFYTSYERRGVQTGAGFAGIGIIQDTTRVSRMTEMGLQDTITIEIAPNKFITRPLTQADILAERGITPTGWSYAFGSGTGIVEPFKEYYVPRQILTPFDESKLSTTYTPPTPTEVKGAGTMYIGGPMGVIADILYPISKPFRDIVEGGRRGGIFGEGGIVDRVVSSKTLPNVFLGGSPSINPLSYAHEAGQAYPFALKEAEAQQQYDTISKDPSVKEYLDWTTKNKEVLDQYSADVDKLKRLASGKTDAYGRWKGTEEEYLAFNKEYDAFQSKYGQLNIPTTDTLPTSTQKALKDMGYWEGQTNLWDAQIKQVTPEISTLKPYQASEIMGGEFIWSMYQVGKGGYEWWAGTTDAQGVHTKGRWEQELGFYGVDLDVLQHTKSSEFVDSIAFGGIPAISGGAALTTLFPHLKGQAWSTLGQAATLTMNLPAEGVQAVPMVIGGVAVLGHTAFDPKRSVIKEYVGVYLPYAGVTTAQRAYENPVLFSYEMMTNYLGMTEGVALARGLSGFRILDTFAGEAALKQTLGSRILGTSKYVVSGGDARVRMLTWTNPITSLKIEFGLTPQWTQGAKIVPIYDEITGEVIDTRLESSTPTRIIRQVITQDAPSKYRLELPSQLADAARGTVVKLSKVSEQVRPTTHETTLPSYKIEGLDPATIYEPLTLRRAKLTGIEALTGIKTAAQQFGQGLFVVIPEKIASIPDTLKLYGDYYLGDSRQTLQLQERTSYREVSGGAVIILPEYQKIIVAPKSGEPATVFSFIANRVSPEDAPKFVRSLETVLKMESPEALALFHEQMRVIDVAKGVEVTPRTTLENIFGTTEWGSDPRVASAFVDALRAESGAEPTVVFGGVTTKLMQERSKGLADVDVLTQFPGVVGKEIITKTRWDALYGLKIFDLDDIDATPQPTETLAASRSVKISIPDATGTRIVDVADIHTPDMRAGYIEYGIEPPSTIPLTEGIHTVSYAEQAMNAIFRSNVIGVRVEGGLGFTTKPWTTKALIDAFVTVRDVEMKTGESFPLLKADYINRIQGLSHDLLRTDIYPRIKDYGFSSFESMVDWGGVDLRSLMDQSDSRYVDTYIGDTGYQYISAREPLPITREVKSDVRLVATVPQAKTVSLLGFRLFDVPTLSKHVDVTGTGAIAGDVGLFVGGKVEALGVWKPKFQLAAMREIAIDIPDTFRVGRPQVQEFDPWGERFPETRRVDAHTVSVAEPVRRLSSWGLNPQHWESIVMRENYIPNLEAVGAIPAMREILKTRGVFKETEWKAPSEFKDITEPEAMSLATVWSDARTGKISTSEVFMRQIAKLEADIKYAPAKPRVVFGVDEVVFRKEEMREVVSSDAYVKKMAGAMEEKYATMDSPIYGKHGAQHAETVYQNLLELQRQYPETLGKYSPETLRQAAYLHDIANFEDVQPGVIEGVSGWLPHEKVAAEAIAGDYLNIPELKALTQEQRGILAMAIKESHMPTASRYDLGRALQIADQMAWNKKFRITDTTKVYPELGIEFIERVDYFKDTVQTVPMQPKPVVTKPLGEFYLDVIRSQEHVIGGSLGQAIQSEFAREWKDFDLYMENVAAAKFQLMEITETHADVFKKYEWTEKDMRGLFDVHKLEPTGAYIGRYGIVTEKPIKVGEFSVMPIREQVLRKTSNIAQIQFVDERGLKGYFTAPESWRGKEVADSLGISATMVHDIQSNRIYQALTSPPIAKTGNIFVDYTATLSHAIGDVLYGRAARELELGAMGLEPTVRPEYLPLKGRDPTRTQFDEARERIESFTWETRKPDEAHYRNIPLTKKYVKFEGFSYETLTRPFNELGDTARIYTRSTWESARQTARGMWAAGERKFEAFGKWSGLDDTATLFPGGKTIPGGEILPGGKIRSVSDVELAWRELADISPLKTENLKYQLSSELDNFDIRRVGSIEESVAYYSSLYGYEVLNTFMRHGEVEIQRKGLLSSKLELEYVPQHIENIYSGFIPSPKEITVYRGVGGTTAVNLLNRIESGNLLQSGALVDRGFMSTSIHPERAEQFAKIIETISPINKRHISTQVFIEHTIQPGEAILPRTLGLNVVSERELILPPGKLSVEAVLPSRRVSEYGGYSFKEFEPITIEEFDQTTSRDIVVKTKRESTFGFVDTLKDLWSRGEQKFSKLGEMSGLDESGMLFPPKETEPKQVKTEYVLFTNKGKPEKAITDLLKFEENALVARSIDFVGIEPAVKVDAATWMKDALTEKGLTRVVALEDTRIVGAIGFKIDTFRPITKDATQRIDFLSEPIKQVQIKWVGAIEQGKGIGTNLMGIAETYALEHGAERAKLYPSSYALDSRFYDKLMYERVGEDVDYMMKPLTEETAVKPKVKRDEIRLVESETTFAKLKELWKRGEEKFVKLGEMTGLDESGLLLPPRKSPKISEQLSVPEVKTIKITQGELTKILTPRELRMWRESRQRGSLEDLTFRYMDKTIDVPLLERTETSVMPDTDYLRKYAKEQSIPLSELYDIHTHPSGTLVPSLSDIWSMGDFHPKTMRILSPRGVLDVSRVKGHWPVGRMAVDFSLKYVSNKLADVLHGTETSPYSRAMRDTLKKYRDQGFIDITAYKVSRRSEVARYNEAVLSDMSGVPIARPYPAQAVTVEPRYPIVKPRATDYTPMVRPLDMSDYYGAISDVPKMRAIDTGYTTKKYPKRSESAAILPYRTAIKPIDSGYPVKARKPSDTYRGVVPRDYSYLGVVPRDYITRVYPKEYKAVTYPNTYTVPVYPVDYGLPKYPRASDYPAYPRAADYPKYPPLFDYPKYPPGSDYPGYPPSSDYLKYPPGSDYPRYPPGYDVRDYPPGYTPGYYPPGYTPGYYPPGYTPPYTPPYYHPPYTPPYPPPYPPRTPPPPPRRKLIPDQWEWRKFKKQGFFLFAEITPTWSARQMTTMFPNRLTNTRYNQAAWGSGGVGTPRLKMPKAPTMRTGEINPFERKPRKSKGKGRELKWLLL